ncbi:PREDICTED: pentatricopeptide repeat-containing protein At1g10910, chloroplastic isoform X1 [Camelina sativa]|uniref:Pentatricopeptide repeat-containing protein At1g10910, chloroplastic isoform X1 n=2 Tax=Camelina sativa TaxID=90675 RepID=A0ABM0VMK3_CAMSA|nr:PREDICTED: pentatricopeptide repeat-containing protein At1g10910, chloroplastic isoform X1 [Camelina sativa]
METPVLGFELRCPHLFFNTHCSRSSSSLSLPAVSLRILTSAAATTAVESPATVTEAPRSKRHSTAYLTRKSAISKVQRSSDFLSSLQRLARVLKVQDLNVILRDFGISGRLQDLIQLFEWMQQRGKISVSTYSSCIKFVGAKNVSKALEIYNSIPDESTKINVFICNSILSCLVKNGKLDSCIKLFDQMKRDGLQPDVVTYNTLLAGCIKVKNGYHKAMELVGELPHNGIQMDSVMYGTVLAVCASNGRCEEAENFIRQMKAEGHSPNIYHYSSLLNSYSWKGDYKKADELMAEMKSIGLVPNKVMMTTLLKVYIKGGLFDRSRELLSELESAGYAENEMPYCMLMDGLSKAGKLEEARSIFDDMKGKGVKSDGYANSIMISALCRSKRFEEANELSRNSETTYAKCDLVMLNTMLCAYCRAGDMESVMRMMKKMDEQAVSPDYNTFHILIKYFIKEKLYLLAYQTILDMDSKGHRLEEELCSSLIYHLGKIRAQSEAFSVYNMLRYSKRTICKELHEKILHTLIQGNLLKDAYVVVKDNAKMISQPTLKKFGRAFMISGNINLVNDVLKVLHGSGHKIDQVQFEIAISRYISQSEKKELLLQLLQWMPGQGYIVDFTTRNLILKNSHLFGRLIIAEILSKHHVASRPITKSRSKPKFRGS